MVVTITTDASYNLRHKLGTYAYMIKCDEGLWSGSGRLKFTPGGSWEAECGAIGNALAALCKLKFKQPVGLLVINTDSKEAIRHIKKGSRFEIGRRVGAQLKATGKKLHLQNKNIQLRHCKAHVGGTALQNEARHKAQQWCDDAAYKLMGVWLDSFKPMELKC